MAASTRHPDRERPLRLRLHERGFTSIWFHVLETAWKSMRFESVYTEPFSYSLRHAEVITDLRDLGKKESFCSSQHGKKYISVHLD